jgi:hypothetical protein
MNNKVELIGVYGSDDIHACSAWTSTGRDITEEQRNLQLKSNMEAATKFFKDKNIRS